MHFGHVSLDKKHVLHFLKACGRRLTIEAPLYSEYWEYRKSQISYDESIAGEF